LTELTVDAFLDAVGVALGNAGQIVPWPMHVARIAPYYSDIEADDLMRRLRALRRSGADPSAIAALYPSASSAKSLMLDLIPGMKDAGLPAADRLDFVSTVFAGLAEREHGDVFCRDGSHRLLSCAQAAELAGTLPWASTGRAGGAELARAAFTASGAAQSLVWSIHFYGWTDISFVIHGPYQVTAPDGTPAAMVVRDFFDLATGELWPELPAAPCGAIQLFTLHDGSDTFTIDIFNHLLHGRALLASTRWVSLLVDGAPCEQGGAITGLRRAIVAIVRQQKDLIDKLGERELAAKFVESRYYAFRHWRSAAGERWQPPADVYRRLRDLPVPPEPTADLPWPALREIFDPRLDWAPQPAPGAGTP
jgi:hypothetical protein